MLKLNNAGHALPLLVEKEAHKGVVRVAGKVAGDVKKVVGVRPAILKRKPVQGAYILCATLGCSPMADRLIAAGKLPEAEKIRGKWECYVITLVDGNLVILGSDKRGTIYGMFALSEYIGVSPLHYWGDAEPAFRPDAVIGEDICTVSREPSVRYRGLFINDEWPCFGTWATEHFGGVNAKMYDHVFELLLRLKGNYMWPAMWRSVFGEEGPGLANEELADEYGIVVGNSHHEPCLRAGEEFSWSIRDGGQYGTEWNFRKNREGITRFWEDGLKRSGKYEHLVTIGMRGENDSAMLGEDSGLRANIEYLKDVITVQEALIRKHCAQKVQDNPRVLALYKEVEPFFYGNEAVEGLKDWDGLRNTVCMLCEDNFGFMRSLPTPELTEKLKMRGCGWGMYYHVDYHGGPISYEWMPSTPFSKLWEQMCLAYDYGIRDVWILNVGDLKGNEVSLQQFLDLAYDFDRWGSAEPENWRRWVRSFVERSFPGMSADEQLAVELIFTALYDLNGKRRPEALHADVYHPCHERETQRVQEIAYWLKEDYVYLKERLLRENRRREYNALYSMLGWPLEASLNLLDMHLSAGLNAHYAAQVRPIANRYAEQVTRTLAEDKRIAREFASFRGGKWRGMEQEQHIGFTRWNEDGCRMPLRTTVEPFCAPRLSLSRADSTETYGRVYGKPLTLLVDDFCDAGVDWVQMEIANDGVGELSWCVEGGAPWLKLSRSSGVVSDISTLTLECDRTQLTEEEQCTVLTLRSDGPTEWSKAAVYIEVRARKHAPNALPAYMPRQGVVTIEAHHFCHSEGTEKGSFRVLEGLGRSGQGVKVYPNTAAFKEDEAAPCLTYRFLAEKPGAYTVELWTAPTSPVQTGLPMRCTLTGPDGAWQVVETVPADYVAGSNADPRWQKAMLDHIRKTKAEIHCEAGLQEITVGALDPNLILERVLIYPVNCEPGESYLGPIESFLL